MENVKIINRALETSYGRALDGKPKFRVVFSNDLFEVRRGQFERYTEGGIYLGSFEGVQKAPKYTYIRDKYILEVYTKAFPEIFGRSILHSSGTIESGDFYEPLRVFKDKDNNYLPPNETVCRIICNGFLELVNRPAGQRLTEKDALADEVKQYDKEVATFFDMLKSEDSDVLASLRFGEGVALGRGLEKWKQQ